MCLYVIIILLHDLTLLRCETSAIDIGSLKATYLLTYLLTYVVSTVTNVWRCVHRIKLTKLKPCSGPKPYSPDRKQTFDESL